jgi:hypothetical protein
MIILSFFTQATLNATGVIIFIPATCPSEATIASKRSEDGWCRGKAGIHGHLRGCDKVECSLAEFNISHPELTVCYPELTVCYPELTVCHPELVSGSHHHCSRC